MSNKREIGTENRRKKVFLGLREYVCECVCVCEREREDSERQKELERQRERKRRTPNDFDFNMRYVHDFPPIKPLFHIQFNFRHQR